MTDNFKPAQLQKLALAGSGCTASATSITLQSLTLPDGSTTVAMTDLGSIAYGTLEPGTSKEEQISFTGVTQNADGTATLTGVTRGLGFISPYTTVSANQKAHAGGAVFVLSNTAGFYDKILIKDNDETITGTFTFSTVPAVSSDPVSGDDVARRSWVLTVVNGGAVSTDKITVTATAGETLVAGNLVYLKSADGYWWKTDADTAATVEGVILGIAQGAGSAAGSISSGVLLAGTDTNQSGLTIGATQYASNTAGGIASSAGTTSKKIGVARTSTNLYFDPNFGSLPTSAQIAALAGGSTFGTPSSSNKFVTEEFLTASETRTFGDGTDGAVTISSPTTLTKDMNYTDLTVNSTLTTDGYAIYVSGTLTGTGTINWGTATVGGAASGTTAGIAGAQSGNGRLKNIAGSAGGNGAGTGSGGDTGTSKTSAITSGAAGGEGGSPDGGAGGVGGTATKPSPRIGTAGAFSIGGVAISATGTLENISAGAGAGGGGGGGSQGAGSGDQGAGGGGGGASGGTILIGAQTWAGTFTIQSIGAVGGAGAAATGSHTGDGGGGGGGGGCGGTSIVVYKTKTWSGTYTLTGGAGGAGGVGTGTGATGGTGVTGTTGTSYEVSVVTVI